MRKKLGSILILLALLCQIPVCAAAGIGSPYVVCQPGSTSDTAFLSLAGLTDKVYGAQLELVWNSPQPSAVFTPSNPSAYSPRCLVQAAGSQTHVTVYLDLTSCPTDAAAPALGTLHLGNAYTPPAQARITLLDRDLKPYANANGAWVGVNSAAQTPSGGGTGYYWITTAPASHGTLTVDPVQAQPGTEITISAVPDPGYKRVELTATSASGQRLRVVHVRNERYTFTMPASPVHVSVIFEPQTATPGTTTPAGRELPFTDVREKDWFYDAVSYVYDQGLMSGTDETRFSPNVTTTRAMIVAILYKLEGQPESGLSDFTDVPAHQYYAAPVAWAASHGIVSGYGGGLFGPNDPITREQMARILYQYAQMKGYPTNARADLSRFADESRISGYARDAMSWANAMGLINGLDDGLLSPGGGATRAQAASILMNFCENAAR